MDKRQEQVRQQARASRVPASRGGRGAVRARRRGQREARGLGAAMGMGLVATAAAGALIGGCLDRDLRPVVPCVTQGFVETIDQNLVDKVDLLFMVDNSGSMAEEQASLAEQLPRLVRVLVSGDRDGDNVRDFQPVKDLHVGVISSDMGTGGFTVPTCRNSMFGDDGILKRTGNTSIPGCNAMYPPFLAYQPGISPESPEEFGSKFGCVATLGTNGCGFEQQLEAPLKALTPSSDTSITFVSGTLGHGDNPATNGGFLRPDSVIAVILVTDEEDCSIRTDDPRFLEIFNQSSTVYTGDLNLRCYFYKEPQWPVQRYIDGFKKLRPGREKLVVFGAITGVPVDLIPESGRPDYDRILNDPRMIEMVDTTVMGGGRLVPSCNVPGRGIAFPPRRIVEVARGFGENGVVQSICQADFTGAVDAIIAKIADALGNVCLPRKLNRTAEGTVGCDVIVRLPTPGTFPGAPSRCAEVPGVEPIEVRTNRDGTVDCRAIQLPSSGGMVPAGAGWYYDDFSNDRASVCGANGQRIAFTAEATPPNGVTVNLECLQRIQGAGSGTMRIDIGSFCSPGDGAACNATVGGFRLGCDPETRTCQVPCSTDADCPTSFVCDTRTSSSFCRNPICAD